MFSHKNIIVLLLLFSPFCIQAHVVVQSTNQQKYTLYDLNDQETEKVYVEDLGLVQENTTKIITKKAYVIQNPQKRPKKKKFLGYFYKDGDPKTKYYVYK